MHLIDFIGFFIGFFALIFLFVKKKYEDKYRREHPKEYALRQKMKEEALSKLMGVNLYSEENRHTRKRYEAEEDSDEDEEDEEDEDEWEEEKKNKRVQRAQKLMSKPPSVSSSLPLVPKYGNKLDFSWKKNNSQTAEGAPTYNVERLIYRSRGGDLINKLHSQRDMLIYKELFDKPLALRKPSGDIS